MWDQPCPPFSSPGSHLPAKLLPLPIVRMPPRVLPTGSSYPIMGLGSVQRWGGPCSGLVTHGLLWDWVPLLTKSPWGLISLHLPLCSSLQSPELKAAWGTHPLQLLFLSFLPFFSPATPTPRQTRSPYIHVNEDVCCVCVSSQKGPVLSPSHRRTNWEGLEFRNVTPFPGSVPYFSGQNCAHPTACLAAETGPRIDLG